MNRPEISSQLKLPKGMKAIKLFIWFFSVIFLIFGISLIVIGSILSFQFKDMLDFQGRTGIGSVAGFIIGLGIVVTIISFVGSTGMFRESRCTILTFSAFLIITFFCELVVVFVGFTFKDRLYTILEEDMFKSMNSTDSSVMNTWNVIQREFKCCGFDSPYDWYKRSDFLPYSCCAKEFSCPSYDNPSFPVGCHKFLTKWTSTNLSIIAGIALFFAVIQIFGTTFSCLIARSIKKSYESVY